MGPTDHHIAFITIARTHSKQEAPPNPTPEPKSSKPARQASRDGFHWRRADRLRRWARVLRRRCVEGSCDGWWLGTGGLRGVIP